MSLVARGSATAALVDLVHGLGWDDLPVAGVELVRNAFLDCLGCMLAGAGTEDAAPVERWVGTLGGGSDCVVVGSSLRSPAALAALANGTSAHALDLDDFSPTMMHPSVCLVPAVLALGEREHASGREMMTAYAAGFEAMARLCRALNPEHYARGWHSTATAGVIGAAVAAGRLLQLTPAQMTTAIAIAASWAGGLRDNFGSAVKPLHAGSAAMHGIAAAELAAEGLTAAAQILDGERGYLAVLAAKPPELAPFLATELELTASGIAFKRFACCGAIHTALDGLLELRAEHELTPDDVVSIRCGVNSWAPEILIHHAADTPAEGRFCVEYSLAVALVDGEAGFHQYTEERVADPAVRSLMQRVEVYVDDALAVDKTTFPATVTIQTVDGRELSRVVDVARGTPEVPLATEELVQKFRACASTKLSPTEVDSVLEALLGLEGVDDVAVLARALAA